MKAIISKLLVVLCFLSPVASFRSIAGRRSIVMMSSPVSPYESSRKGLGTFIKVMKVAPVALLMNSNSARAGFFQSAEQDGVDALSQFQKPIAELLDQLRPAVVPNAVGVYIPTQVLKGGKEDSAVVLTYMETIIKPCQQKMSNLASTLHLSEEEAQTRVEVLPQLMKGHIIELTEAIKEMKAESQAREVEEVLETLAEFLKLAATKYNVTPYVPTRPLTDAELYGPLGCEFWGKKRVPGSNACYVPEPDSSSPQ